MAKRMQVGQKAVLKEDWGPIKAGSVGTVRQIDAKGRVVVEVARGPAGERVALVLPPSRQKSFQAAGAHVEAAAPAAALTAALHLGDRVTLLEQFGPANAGSEGVVRYVDSQGRVTVAIEFNEACVPLTILLPPSRASRFARGSHCS